MTVLGACILPRFRWVEDPNSSREGRDIAAFSYFNQHAAMYGNWKNDSCLDSAQMGSIVEGSIRLKTPVWGMEIIGQTEDVAALDREYLQPT